MPYTVNPAINAAAASTRSDRRAVVCAERVFVRRLIARDADTWDEFLTRYGRLIAARSADTLRELGHSGSGALLEDCSSEVIASLISDDMAALRRFRGRSKLSTWLSVVARRVTIRHWQQTRRQQPAVHGDSKFEFATFDPNAAYDGRALFDEYKPALVAAARRQLNDGDRRVLELCYDDGLSYREIADALGISINAVGPKLHRAQQRLKRLLERQDATTQGGNR